MYGLGSAARPKKLADRGTQLRSADGHRLQGLIAAGAQLASADRGTHS